MEFLRSQFEEELDGDGDVEIAGQSFLRTEILRGLRPDVYEIAFGEWIENRKSELIENADTILADFDNEPRFERLHVAFQSGGMMPFVGAGMSVASGFPAWTPMLCRLCRESRIAEIDLDDMLNQGLYEKAAELIHNDLGSALFNEKIEAIFARDRTPQGVICLLPELFPNSCVLTTNFDSLIEKIYDEDKYEGFDLVKSGRSLREVVRQIAAGSRLLIKMHGDCRQVADRVLLESEYVEAYGDDGVVRQFFNRVMFGKAILFLGCRLTSDRTITAMKGVVSEHGAEQLPRHYAILDVKTDDDKAERERHLAEANVFPIWYPEDEHDVIEALLVKLME